MSNGKPITTVYISNLSEDVWPFICQMSDPQSRAVEIEENAGLLAERDLLTNLGENNLIVVQPKHIGQEFLQYYFSLFGNKKLRILVPRVHTGEISFDALKDPFVFEELKKIGQASSKLELIAYTTSPQFLDLVDALKTAGIGVSTPESPEEEDAWTVDFYGSKSGVRQLAQQMGANEPDFKMAPGLICMGIVDAAKIAAKMYVKEDAVVVKTNKGHSGAGILIFRPGELPTIYSECEKNILASLKKENYWQKFPIIIEDYVEANTTIGGGFPNVEFKILKTGKVDFLYSCGLRVTRDGVFNGIEISNDVFSDKISVQIMDTGFFIGEQYVRQGYRGYFDVDFVVGKNGEIYVTESNVRRTGGTHVYHTAVQLFGKDFMYETYTLSNNNYQLPRVVEWSLTQLTKLLTPLLFNKTHSEGLIITATNALVNKQFGYIIFGKTKKRALEIEHEMEELLKQAEN